MGEFPSQKDQFKPGRSGNPKGRPPGRTDDEKFRRRWLAMLSGDSRELAAIAAEDDRELAALLAEIDRTGLPTDPGQPR